jgi:hypothetical protein
MACPYEFQDGYRPFTVLVVVLRTILFSAGNGTANCGSSLIPLFINFFFYFVGILVSVQLHM